MSGSIYHCWLCDSQHIRLTKTGNLKHKISSNDFRITDANYGVTTDIYTCVNCSFKFCPTVVNTLTFYKNMSDDTYEATRLERSLQAKKILRLINRFKINGRLLDVGAGSGILVEQALIMNYEASGIEPSNSLSAAARKLNIPVVTGTLPLSTPHLAFDIVTLIDVIEHVENPRAILQEIGNCLQQDGICVLVTPDVSSFAARIMHGKWWHYRLAHIGYFNRQTLQRLASSAGFNIIATYRPAWYFPGSYLAERLLSYLPGLNRIKSPKWLDKITIPLNLFDSLLIVCKKKTSD